MEKRKGKSRKIGWVEVNKNGSIVQGDIGIKVFKKREDIFSAGFGLDEIAKVEIKII